MIDICNLKNNKCVNVFDIKVDRSSILGNPFYMKDESKRDEVCDKYKEYFYNKLIYKDDVLILLRNMINIYKEYGKLRLFCWCAPKRCHAEVIRDYIYNILGE